MSKTYRYRIKGWQMILGILFFAACGWVIWGEATAGVSGLSIFRVITLGPVAGTAVIWGLFGACVIFVLIAILGLIKSLSAEDAITIDAAGITAPNRLIFGRSVFVPFRDITKFSELKMNRQHILTIHYAGGKLALTRSGFDNTATFEEARQTLVSRANGQTA